MSAHRFLERAGLRRALRRLYRIEVHGAERIPATGPAVVVANHASIWDPFVLSVATPREIQFMAKAELFHLPLVARALRALNAFPVERGRGDRAAVEEAARRLEQGALLGIFPQGTSKPELQNGWHRGAARLALATGAPVVPVRLRGTRPLPWRTRIRIEVGEPITVPVSRPTGASARALTERLVEAVGAA